MEKMLEKKLCYFVKERFKEPHEAFVGVSETDARMEAAL